MRTLNLALLTAVVLAVAACGRSPAEPSNPAPLASGSLFAKGGGKPPSLERPVVADVRCPGITCPGSDRVSSDGGPYTVSLGPDGNLGFSLSDTARRVNFTFSDCVEPCAVTRRWFTTASVGASNGLWMHTSVLLPGSDVEASGGLHAIPVGATWLSRIKILFSLTDPTGQEIGWAIRFNPFFPGSTNLQVTRVTEAEWLLEATPSQRAWLQAAPTGRRAGEPTFEGNYLMPFQIRLTVP